MSVIVISDQIFPVELAISPEEQAKGLMYRNWPPPIMVFPGKTEIKRFWMRNTPCPLDILFCNNEKIVDIFFGKPFSLKEFGPKEKCNLVIEMPHGFAEKFNLKKDDKINLQYSLNDLSKIFENKYM